MPSIFGAVETVEAGEVVDGATVGFDSPIDALYALSGATIVVTELLSGGYVEVNPGAVAIDTVFSGDRFSRGLEEVYGVDSAAQICGGTQSVNSGGVAIGATVSAFGQQNVSSGGLAIDTTVSSGGALILSAGAATGTTVSQGGIELVSSGGVDNGTIVGAGGAETVSSGGTASDVAVLAGGTLRLDGGATAGGFTVASGGTLVIGSDFFLFSGYALSGYTVSPRVLLDVERYASAIGAT